MLKENAQSIVDHILWKGGTMASAARELDISLTAKTREAVYELCPDVDRYRYAFRRIGNWYILPSDKAENRDKQKVNAVCLLCNTIHLVSLINIEAGRSKQCYNCKMTNRQQHLIVCQQTGEVYSSIRKLASSLGKLRSYQTIRHSLNNSGSYRSDDRVYVLT